tara:strand:+ start:679 stop:1422 length:744 start_codon:yes stop_codon:yes gene_type:complete
LNFFSLFKRKLIYNFKKKTLVDNDNLNSDSLDYLLHHYGSDKANIFKKNQNKGHGYSFFYEKKLGKFKSKNINILELGSYSGASAAAFAKYFPGSNLFCFDINISNFIYKSKQIHVHGADITNEKKIKQTLKDISLRYGVNEFDIIIDDASHNLSDILVGLKIFFKFVKKGGFYIIEDFKYPNYHQYNRNIDHILIDELLEKFEQRRVISSSLLTEKDQLYLMNSIEKIENFKGNLFESDISFLSKK